MLEHEEAVGDLFEETEERGLTRNGVSTVTALCQWGLVDGGSIPWSGRPTPRPKNIVEPGACSGRCRPGRTKTGGGSYGKDLDGGWWDFSHSMLCIAWTLG
jgi:hypothetical protein